jgi:polar amino acid transport system substrate-binding protein
MKRVQLAVLIGLLALSSMGFSADLKQLSLVCDDWPPYQIIHKDRISGFSTAVVKTVLQRMGTDGVFLDAYPWKRAILMLEKGLVDGLFSANHTVQRAGFALYPDEAIVETPWVMWVRKKDGLTLESWQDLSGLTVGLVRGYSYTPEFWRFMKTQGRYEVVSDDEKNFKKLNAGRVDVVVAELGNGLYLLDKLGIKGVVPLVAHPVKVDGLYIIFSKKRVSPSFVQAFSAELGRLKKESAYQRLHETYLLIEQPTDPGPPPL